MTPCARCDWEDVRRDSPTPFLLPPPRIVQSRPENRFHIEIDDHQIFLKLFAAREEITVLVKDKAVTVKHQFILASDQIVIRHDYGIVCSAGGEHTFAPVPLSGVIRGRRNVDDDLGSTRERLLEDRPIRVPDILTDA